MASEVVGLIPARGGSKAIPGKNLAPAAGRPLLAWTIDAALASRRLTRAVVSTDSEEISTVARSLGAEVLPRPAALAADDTPMLNVIVHARGELGPCDVLVVLQPTSPLRRAEHVDEAVDLLLATGADTVVSVVEVPHAFRPGSLMRIEDGRLLPLEPDTPLLRQAKLSLYARNGPAVLALRPERLDPVRGLYAGDCRPYLMDARDSLDVDGPFELELAALLLSGSPDSAGRSEPSAAARPTGRSPS
jgi:CMP-N-acetylneuraminic acid synthetase